MRSISIIVPTLNEAEALPETLNRLLALEPPALEIIVVDGGSTDGTLEIANQYNVRVVKDAQQGRGFQLNAGAAVAQGDALCFVHADTLVPNNLVHLIRQTLDDPSIALGGFVSVMRGPTGVRKFTTAQNFLKTYYAAFIPHPIDFLLRGYRLLVGDQVMFCRKDQFEACGRFPEEALMEDMALNQRLLPFGRIVQRKERVYTSDRRVAAWGELRASMTYLTLGVLWLLGVSGKRLAKYYSHIRSENQDL